MTPERKDSRWFLASLWFVCALPVSFMAIVGDLLTSWTIAFVAGFVYLIGLILGFCERGYLKRSWAHYVGALIVLLMACPIALPYRVTIMAHKGAWTTVSDQLRSEGEHFSKRNTVAPGVVGTRVTDSTQCLWTRWVTTGGAGFCRQTGNRHHLRDSDIVALPLGDNWYYVVEE